MTDNAQRHTALNSAESYIVQAPAGSGKTELLTQRYLRLLAQVTQPEQILAITFTRKAAAEMRQRVLAAFIQDADEPPDAPHQAITWQLAQAARAQDTAQGWQLSRNPHRLRLQTFDSLAAELTRQLPVLAELGAQPTVTEQALPCYQQAARATIASLTETDMAPHLSAVLRHLDNQADQLEALISRMLPRREQWLPTLLDLPDVACLETALQAEIEHDLHQLMAAWEPDLLAEVIRLAQFAATHVPVDHVLQAWVEPPASLLPEWSHLHWWRGLATLLLTTSGTWRKTADKRIGFPSPQDTGITAQHKRARRVAKADLRTLLTELAHNVDLRALLVQVLHLPVTGYQIDQIALLAHLRMVLLRAAAELRLVFQATGEVDFAELQQRAIQALGAETAPTDLALALDHRIRHILVDEFQDTSVSQYRLLRLLTAGWQPGDGRTLFVVGDPMQSIYRFREAEVGLYLRTRTQGLSDIALTPLTLQMNFRSTSGIVNWVNQTFQALFPAHVDVHLGAVPYSPSCAASDAGSSAEAVHWHLQAGRDDAEEARQIADLIRRLQCQQPQAQIAVLARSRRHLPAIASALTVAGIRYQTVDIDPLQHRPVVQDLRSLTGALLHPADRLAWLALLRTPWVGLTLADLLVIAAGSEPLIYAAMQNPVVQEQLSPDGLKRVQRLLRLLQPCLPYRARQPLRTLVEGFWLALGGLALSDAAGVADAQAYFDLLAQITPAHGLPDYAWLNERLAQLYAAPDPQADGCVQMMTLHAAKGLEFDVVILPGLGRRTRRNPPDLLYWQERIEAGSSSLLMAPIRATATDSEPIADYIIRLQHQKERLETMRLLYVAATRARQQLHLFGHCTCNSKGVARPAADSLLQALWPVAELHYVNTTQQDAVPESETRLCARTEQRLPPDWQLVLPESWREPPLPASTLSTELTQVWVSDTARHTGTLVHRYLERVTLDGLDQWPPERIAALSPAIRTGLAHLGVSPSDLTSAADTVRRALHNTLTDTRGRWILSPHQSAASEQALTLQQSQGQSDARHYVIDRTFVDEADTRWIIDYKTAEPGSDQSLADFMRQQQEQYQKQLHQYAHILHQMEDRPIQLALYFPLCCGWQAWAWTAAT